MSYLFPMWSNCCISDKIKRVRNNTAKALTQIVEALKANTTLAADPKIAGLPAKYDADDLDKSYRPYRAYSQFYSASRMAYYQDAEGQSVPLDPERSPMIADLEEIENDARKLEDRVRTLESQNSELQAKLREETSRREELESVNDQWQEAYEMKYRRAMEENARLHREGKL